MSAAEALPHRGTRQGLWRARLLACALHRHSQPSASTGRYFAPRRAKTDSYAADQLPEDDPDEDRLRRFADFFLFFLDFFFFFFSSLESEELLSLSSSSCPAP